jgi:molybdenum cofactor cytidylyltransferase
VPVSGVIVAAGESRRLGRPKQLLDYLGRPLLEHAVRNAVASRLSEVIVVLGANRDQILQSVDFLDARHIGNERYSEGMSTSLVAALAQTDPQATGILFLLGDQPGVTTDVIDAVLDAFDGTPESIVMPSWQGVPANPVLIGRGYLPELMALHGDVGARPIVDRHRDRIRLVEIDRPVPPDIDTEVDYQRLLAAGNSPPIR